MTYRVFLAFDVEADNEKEARERATALITPPARVQDIQMLETTNKEDKKELMYDYSEHTGHYFRNL